VQTNAKEVSVAMEVVTLVWYCSSFSSDMLDVSLTAYASKQVVMYIMDLQCSRGPFWHLSSCMLYKYI
jgi:hypothetical protein